MDNYDDLRPISGETRYVEFDSEFDCWAIFGSSSGFCYGQFSSQDAAEKSL